MSYFPFLNTNITKKASKVEVGNIDYAPFTYILTNEQLKVGKIVISYD
jgi:hypothetical protein